MKLVRRRSPGSSPAATDGGRAGDPVVAEPSPPRGAVVAAYAQILDGAHLWVAVDDRPGTLALRAAGSQDPVVPRHPGAATLDDQPGYRSAVLPLDDVTVGTAYDVVLVPDSGRSPQPVWTPGPGTSPGTAVTAPDGRSRLSLLRTEDGTLRVRREALAASVLLQGVSAEPDALALRLAAPELPVALVAEDGTTLATIDPVDGVVRLTTDHVAGCAAQPTRVVAQGADGRLPVRRRSNDLSEPGRGAPLPELRDPATGAPRLRLRWDGQGLLLARIVDEEQDR